MNKLNKEKRNQLALVVAGIAVVLVVLYFGLIHPQYETLGRSAAAVSNKTADLQKRRNTIKMAAAGDAKFKDATAQLASAESDIASGDFYAWTYDLIRRFKANYKVEIPTIAEPAVQDMDLLPSFPYRQIRLTLTGTAFYHDLGKFVSDFENTYPHIRIVNLSMTPAAGAGEPEKLAFRFDIVALVKGNS